MFTLYADSLYLLAIFVLVAVAAIIGLWQYNATSEASTVRPIVLSDDVRADITRARNKALQEFIDAKRARKAEYRKSLRASRTPGKSDDTAETTQASRDAVMAPTSTRTPPPKPPGPPTPSDAASP